MTGLSLAHYRIDAELGRGGMGIVYRAFDTRLDRTVAIKVLPPHALSSEDDRARFLREAKAAAQLHHPHIATVFEISEAVPSDAPHGSEPRPFIAMEFVDGESLAQRIARGPMKLGDVTRIASQIAEALGAAHEAGVVHRDVKSGNVMLTSKNQAKVLDFGLAKTAASTQLTRQGSTLGTIAYMSPEQARGEEVDYRTDLWALGIILYEMTTGRLPFKADYEQAALYGILNETPEPLTAIRTGVPMELERIVGKLLAKEPNRRYQSSADLIVDLRNTPVSVSGISSASGSPALSQAKPAARRMLWPLLGGLLAGLAIAATGFLLLRPASLEQSAPTVQRFELSIPEVKGTDDRVLSISNDGSMLALLEQANDNVVIIDLRSGTRRQLDFPSPLAAEFSPNAERILISGIGGLSRGRSDGTELIQVRGEQGLQIGAWVDNSTIAISKLTDYVVLVPDVGPPDTLRAPFDGVLLGGNMLDDDRMLFFNASQGSDPALWTLNRRTNEWTRVGEFAEQILSSGHLLYLDEKQDWSIAPIDLESFEPLGPRIPLDYLGSSAAVSEQGTVVYEPRTAASAYELVAEPSGGSSQRLVAAMGSWFDVAPAGDRLVAKVGKLSDQRNLVVVDVSTSLEVRIGPGGDAENPRWAASADRIYYFADDGELVSVPSDRASEATSLREGDGLIARDELAVHPGGTRLAWTVVATDEGFNVGIREMDLATDSTRWLVPPEGFSTSPSYSPDGRLLSYRFLDASLQGPLRILDLEDGRNWTLPLSRDAGDYRWSAAGDGIEYQVGDSLMIIPVDLSDGFRTTGPPELFRYLPGLGHWVRMANGDFFYSRRLEAEEDASDSEEPFKLQVIVNWFEELKRIAPLR